MYKQNRKGWSKHFDFFILDILLLEVAFFLSYGIRHDWVFLYNMDYYRRMGVLLVLVSICVGMIREGYHGVIRREYLDELKDTALHVSITEFIIIVITFFMKDIYYSREVFLLFWFFGIVFCFFGRSILKYILHRHLSVR